MNKYFHQWLMLGILYSCLGLVGVLAFLGCNEPTEEILRPTVELPQEKNILATYHPIEFLTTELVSAPLLTKQNHPHGWQQANCTQCHRIPSTTIAPESTITPETCVKCHGRNGVSGHEDTCATCHQVTHSGGAPSTGAHLAHVDGGPKDVRCVECHPGTSANVHAGGTSNVHANGILDIDFRDGGSYDSTANDGLGVCTTACHEPRPWGGEGCGACHGNPPPTGIHKKHLEQEDVTCRDCHLDNQHDSDNTSGSIELGDIEYNPITGECTSACHEKTEQWGCTGCHDYPPVTGSHDPSIHPMDCETCHQGHEHSYVAATQPLDFSSTMVELAAGGEYHDSTADGLANGTCSDTGCHEPREWGTDCSQCHGNPPISGWHLTHVEDEGNQCLDCHRDNQHDFDNTSGSIEVGGVTFDLLSGGCVSACHEPKLWDCQECHGYPPMTANHPSHATAKLGCKECHADHEHSFTMALDRSNVSDVSVQLAQGGSFDDSSGLCSTPCHEPRTWGSSCGDCHGNPPATGLHRSHVLSDLSCDVCHAGREHDLDNTSGLIEVGDDIRYNNFTGGCTSICHTTEVTWDCSSCHGFPPETGAHKKHAEELQLGCHLCHQGHQHSYRAADPIQQDFKPVKVGFTIRGSWDGQTCANIGCHGDRRWEE